jgi:DNA/RNA endonuclease YhcR with UshA esterase domain
MRKISMTVALTMVMLISLAARADDIAKPQPATIDAADKAALTAAMDTDVAVRGTIKKAEWSQTGKVMNIEFADSELIGAVFEKSRSEIDKAFDGDAAKKWTGAKVTVTGKLAKYGGKSKKLEGRPQIIISKADQVKVEPAAVEEKK